MENLVKEIILHRKRVLIGIVVLLLGFAGYIVNKHIVTVTDYSNGGAEKRIFVFDLSTVKKVPNYAKDKGYELVYKRDYDKYHQGYCLKENRILSDEEIFRRGIKNYLKKEIELYKLTCLYDDQCNQDGSCVEPVGYYVLSGIGINVANLIEKLGINLKSIVETVKKRLGLKKLSYKQYRELKIGLKEMIFKTFKAKLVDNVMDYVTIDMKTMTASFEKSIALGDGEGNYYIYTGKSFLLYKKDDEWGLDPSMIFLFPEIYDNHLWDGPNDRHIEFQEKIGKRDGFDGYYYKIDHCGNIKFNIKETYYKRNQGG